MVVTQLTNTTLADIAKVMRLNDDFVICGHVSPDGDCIGSQLTLWHALHALGKHATCVRVRDEPIGESLEWLPGVSGIIPAEAYEGSCGVFVGVDVPTRERIGVAVNLLDRAATSITIDHHAAESRMCDHVYVDPKSASASILVWELVKELCDKPPFESALCAYTGLMTDTGGFRFQNSDENAFSAASELIAFGVDPAFAAASVFQNRTMASLKLEATVIDRMHVFANGEAVLSWVSSDDMKRFGAIKADAEPLIDSLRSLSGTRVACMLREQDGKVRGSLRSKDETNVAWLARELGGGGHQSAAGFTLDMPLDEAIKFMTKQIICLLDE